MIFASAVVVQTAAKIAIGMVGLALFLTFIRLARGPTLPDRVIALDLMTVQSVGIIAAYSVATDQPVLLEPATVLALLGFLGTVAFARYLERGEQDG